MILMDKKVKERLHEIIFGTDTPAGKAFDIILIIVILSNSLLIIAASVSSIRDQFGVWIEILGWIFVVIFTLEYILRIFVVSRKRSYVLSFFGLVDLVAILPSFLGIFFPELRVFTVIRSIRLLRLFGILKMGRYMDESGNLLRAMRSSRRKITIFLFTILFIVITVGALMYVIEGPEYGFINIPESMYWAVVTVSTVGYGDLSPQTPLGKLVSSLLMIVGYGIIAVPTGIVTHELTAITKGSPKTRQCKKCLAVGYAKEDRFCSKCGTALDQ